MFATSVVCSNQSFWQSKKSILPSLTICRLLLAIETNPHKVGYGEYSVVKELDKIGNIEGR
jgi:hypothetical protein